MRAKAVARCASGRADIARVDANFAPASPKAIAIDKNPLEVVELVKFLKRNPCAHQGPPAGLTALSMARVCLVGDCMLGRGVDQVLPNPVNPVRSHLGLHSSLHCMISSRKRIQDPTGFQTSSSKMKESNGWMGLGGKTKPSCAGDSKNKDDHAVSNA